ncbi:pyridoxal phosphate-dependent aminotransferase [Halalkalibacter oceani]|uniref:pyridoxal phosphate-dependent aminotransferase n=1 Tax=Halalkalibacter oceani TaxID=1653776 RepID=UPI0033973152
MLRTYQWQVDPEQIVVTPGAVTALNATMLALVNRGEEVLIPDPSWPNYEQIALGQGAVPIRYELDWANDFALSLEALEEKVTQKTKLLIINSPSNPAGSIMTGQDIQNVLEFARKHDLYVISDEVYDGILFEGEHLTVKKFDQDDRVISIFGFSKNYAMTGWRVGYAVAPLPIAEVTAKLLEPMVSCASSVSQKAAEAALTGSDQFLAEMTEIYRERKERLLAIFRQANVPVIPPKGAFYMLIDCTELGLGAEEVALKLLEEEQVAAAPGTTFGSTTERMLRISFATEDGELYEAARRIARFIERHRGK